jgi:hypothetical protein
MSETIIILNYRLTRELWQQFLDAHFSSNPTLKMRYLWGVVCIMLGALGFGGFYDSPVIASLLLATGLFGVLSKHLLVAKSLRTACRHPFFGEELTVAIRRTSSRCAAGRPVTASPGVISWGIGDRLPVSCSITTGTPSSSSPRTP